MSSLRRLAYRKSWFLWPILFLVLIALNNYSSTSLGAEKPSIHHRSNEIEIWSIEAQLGEYLWNHILEGSSLELVSEMMKRRIETNVDGLNFTFIPLSTGKRRIVPSSQHVVLVMDGSSPAEQEKTEVLLRRAQRFLLETVLLLVHAASNCTDSVHEWLSPYLKSRGGFIDAVLLVGKASAVDNHYFFHWPLGVQQNFPLFTQEDANVLRERPYVCSYAGKTDRLPFHPGPCHYRTNYGNHSEGPHVAESALWDYVQMITDSDLSLCPPKESHCIYEAFSLGSIPVILSDIQSEADSFGRCKERDNSSLSWLIDKQQAPLMIAHSSDELGELVAREEALSQQEKIARRATVVSWYANFRHQVAHHFLHIFRNVQSKYND